MRATASKYLLVFALLFLSSAVMNCADTTTTTNPDQKSDTSGPELDTENVDSLDASDAATDTRDAHTRADAGKDARDDTSTRPPSPKCTEDPDSCGTRPNAHLAGCAIETCIFACNPGFSDLDDSLNRPGSNGCEAECVPTHDGVEACDGIDNDCDGQVDNGFDVDAECTSAGTGVCATTGKMVCTEDGQGVACDAVPGEPQAEACNGLDNNCDGVIDETDPRVGEGCETSEKGLCHAGKLACQTGTLTCVANRAPSAEVCDGQDNNCDGEVDDGNPGGGGGCLTGKSGMCEAGVRTCVGGSIQCVGLFDATPTEKCGEDGTGTGRDDDCNGIVDDGCASCIEGERQHCYTGPHGTQDVGICRGGDQKCVDGQWGRCDEEVTPQAEVCNRVDDNCDGRVDEDLARSCGSNTGECTAGTQTCSSGDWGHCVGEVGPTVEACDGKDNNCNGTVDEGIPVLACGSDVGECRKGTQTCSGGRFGKCLGQVKPATEVCDGLDNDCDGRVDNGLRSTTYYRDHDGDGYGGTESQERCAPSAEFSATSSGDCNDSDASIHSNATEVCTSTVDHDCDGKVACRDSDCDGQTCQRPAADASGTCQSGLCRVPISSACEGDLDCRIDQHCECAGTEGAVCCKNGLRCLCEIR